MDSTRVASPSVAVSHETVAYMGLIGATVAWAAAFIAGKVVLRELAPLPTGALRHSMAALALLPFALRARPKLASIRKVALPLTVMIVSSGFLYPWLFLEALAHTDATNCSLLVALNPLFTVLLSPLVGEQRHHAWGGVLAALAGAALVITRGDFENLSRMAHLSFAHGDLMAIAAAMMWAAFNLASRSVVRVIPSSVTNVLVYGIGGIGLLLITHDQHPIASLFTLSFEALSSLILMAVLASVVAGQMFLHGVRVVGVNRTVVFIYLVPVLTAILSSLLLGERLGLAQIVGGVAVLAGVYSTTAAPRRRARPAHAS